MKCWKGCSLPNSRKLDKLAFKAQISHQHNNMQNLNGLKKSALAAGHSVAATNLFVEQHVGSSI